MLSKKEVWDMYRLDKNVAPKDCRKEPLWAAIDNRYYPPEMFTIAERYSSIYTFIMRHKSTYDKNMSVPIRVLPIRLFKSGLTLKEITMMRFSILDNIHQAYAGQHTKGLAPVGHIGGALDYEIHANGYVDIIFKPNVSRILFTDYENCCKFCWNRLKKWRGLSGHLYYSYFNNATQMELVHRAMDTARSFIIEKYGEFIPC